MLPSSLPLILMTVAFTTGAVGFLAWVWRKGFLRDFDAQSRAIFDERDFRIVRPWEGAVDRLEREMRFGTPLAPDPGEWGDARAATADDALPDDARADDGPLDAPRPRARTDRPPHDGAPPPPPTPRRRPA